MKRSKLRVLVVNVDLPQFPMRAGHEFLNTTRLRKLVEQVGLISLVHTPDQRAQRGDLEAAGIDLYTWMRAAYEQATRTLPPPRGGIRRRVLRRGLRTLIPLVERFDQRPRDVFIQDYQFRNVAPFFLQALSDSRWHVLVLIQSSLAGWLDRLPRFPAEVLVLHDIRSVLYRRRAQTAATFGERVRCLLEAWRYERYERHYSQQVDLVVTVSRSDEDWVRQHYRPKQVTTLPLPVDASYFASAATDESVPNRIVFTGTMDHLPNVDAACYFARTVLPRIRESVPGAEFWIVGRDPSPEVLALAGLPGVVVTGFVSDIRPYLAQAAVVVVPLRYGSGMRNKILEAWGMQKCVVSTSVGAEGLAYAPEHNILIADTAMALATSVTRALRDTALRDRVRVGGRVLVQTTHQPDTIAASYRDALTAALDTPARIEEPMRVLIDLRWMQPGVAGGIENQTRMFLQRLFHLDAVNQYRLLVPPAIRFDFDLRNRPNFRILPVTGPRQDLHTLKRRASRKAYEIASLDYWQTDDVERLKRLREFDCDVALSMPGYMHPELYPLTNVLVVPDIQHEYHPEFFAPAQLEERRRIYSESIQRAVHICADSEFTRQSLIERLGVHPERVTTILLAADPVFEQGSSARGRSESVMHKYGLTKGQYLLFPANTWPHKNHRVAFQTLRILEDEYGLTPQLVCTGAVKEAHGELFDILSTLKLQDRVKFLGYCPRGDMPGLYEGAAALLFPSFFEGFGMPVLEAMCCECPVVCSNVSSLPEVAGAAAVLADPTAPDEFANGLSRVLCDTQVREDLIQRGRQQANRFSWDTYTLETVRVLHEARNQRLN